MLDMLRALLVIAFLVSLVGAATDPAPIKPEDIHAVVDDLVAP
jgi:hypothetical protein